MAKNEVATTEKNFNLVTLTGELKEAVAEELDGLGTIPFERAKIPSGGGLAFELPGETEDEACDEYRPYRSSYPSSPGKCILEGGVRRRKCSAGTDRYDSRD